MNARRNVKLVGRIVMMASLLVAGLTAEAKVKRAVVVLKSAGSTSGMTTAASTNAMNMVAQALEKNQINVQTRLRSLNSLVVEIHSPQDLERIKNNPMVAFVDEEVMLPAPKPIFGVFNYPHSTSANFQTLSSLSSSSRTPWGIKAIHAPEAWNAARRGEGARIMVLDTGLDKNHPSLRANFEKGQDFTETGSADISDNVGHGTHVAGTIAGAEDSSGFAGVAPSAKILMGRVCSEEGCSSVAIAEGIEWGISEKVDAISMSLGGAISPPSVRVGVEKAEQAGVVIVAASGNDGTNRVGYPAALPTALAVGAVDESLNRAEFSQYGPEMGICAPGVEVYSSLPMGSGRESIITVDVGTQMGVALKNAAVQGAGDFTGKIAGDLAEAGIGRPEDLAKVNVKGKVALMARGTIPFADKVLNAMHAGAVAILIYNNEPGLVRGGIQPSEPVNVPVFIIEQQPGLDLVKAVQGGQKARATMEIQSTDYGALDGTSMATPHVSGVVALIRAANKKLSPAQVRDIIKKTASPVQNSTRGECGAGLINAASAVSTARTASLNQLH